MQKPTLYLFIYLFINVFLFSCKKDNERLSGAIYNSWEAVEIVSVESVLYAKDANYNPVIDFDATGRFTIKLDKNNCVGTFVLSAENEIVINGPGCTEICCDSDFSNKIAVMLPQVTSYSVEGNKLKLNVPKWGWINLELH